MVFPLARDLVGCIRQVCKEIRWELLTVQVLQRECQYWFYQSRLRFHSYAAPSHWSANLSIWPWLPTIRYLKGWTRELRRRARFLLNNYGLDQVVDEQIRAFVLIPEDEWARLPPF